MTPEQINIKIAEACGWRYEAHPNGGGFLIAPEGTPYIANDGWSHRTIPNYHSDLNACAEFEATLTDSQYNDYSDALYDIHMKAQKEGDKWRWLCATAQQRCEAFLRTLGLWEESKCKCSLRTSLVGDGCQVCNPELAGEIEEDSK